MPLYEYTCDPCKYNFEKIRKFSEPDAECDKCHTLARRRISVPGVSVMNKDGTGAQRDSKKNERIGDWPDRNEWIDA
jgi:putative FmdB family regulatory protein